MKEKLLIILGPTAVGKTDLSIDIALRFNGEIISGDSMQVYKGMDIGTAKIKPEEMKGIPHYFIDLFSPDHFFSVAEFQEMASGKISEINRRGNLAIIAGGTGLYIKSVIQQYKFPEAASDETYRHELKEWAEKQGNEALHRKLAAIDPVTADRLHINDLKRVIRALEVYQTTGKPLSRHLEEQNLHIPYDLLMIGLTMDRLRLYERINRRVDLMIEKGLIEEVSELLTQGYDERFTSMQGIGYKEIIKYLRGEISLEDAIEWIKQGTRKFAKRQLSLFRSLPDVYWFDMADTDLDKRNKNIEDIYKIIAGKFSFMKK